MPEIDPNYAALMYGTLLRALESVGLNPMLITRNASQVLSKMFDGPAKQVLGIQHPSTLEELITKLGALKTSGKYEVSHAEGVINLKLVDCMYLPLNNYGKSIGYKSCPMCAQSLLISGSIKALNLGEVKDIQVENNGNICQLKITLSEK
ncbi:MAG: hypothetical protein QXO71_09475 [Candidatus Jordarchaeaceae archaeon]